MLEKKIVILTAGGLNGRRLSHVFFENKIPFELITISFPLPKVIKNNFIFYKKYLRGIFANIYFLRKFKMRKLPSYPVREQFVGRQNGRKMKEVLERIKPDYIFMMGGGILKDNIISIAKEGIINAHPGILPYIRGVDSIKHAILKNIPIGVTGHFIDRGIDTGNIIERYWLPILKENSFEEIVKQSNDLSVAVMAKLAFDIIEGKRIKRIVQSEKHKLCRKLSPFETEKALEKFKKKWYKVHITKAESMDGIKEGEKLLIEYNNWWPTPLRF